MLMARFSRRTVFEACNVLGSVLSFHGELEDLLLRWELDILAENRSESTLHTRCRSLFRHLKDHPDAQSDGQLLSELVVEEAARRCARPRPTENQPEFVLLFIRSLERDGFTISYDGALRRTLPDAVNLPSTDDEVHALLDRYGLGIPKGHLDQAIDAHARGNWAGANSQIRTFYESLLDEIALRIDPQNAPGKQPGEARRAHLANFNPPFLIRALNEWSDDGKNFVNGMFKRLHPQGSHPGLSDEEDSTFRLHLVLLTARLFLRRLATTLGDRP